MLPLHARRVSRKKIRTHFDCDFEEPTFLLSYVLVQRPIPVSLTSLFSAENPIGGLYWNISPLLLLVTIYNEGRALSPRHPGLVFSPFALGLSFTSLGYLGWVLWRLYIFRGQGGLGAPGYLSWAAMTALRAAMWVRRSAAVIAEKFTTAG